MSVSDRQEYMRTYMRQYRKDHKDELSAYRREYRATGAQGRSNRKACPLDAKSQRPWKPRKPKYRLYLSEMGEPLLEMAGGSPMPATDVEWDLWQCLQEAQR